MSPVPGARLRQPVPARGRPDGLPVLVACSHGTASGPGRQAVAGLLAEIKARRPGLPVEQAYVDVQRPHVHEVLRRLAGQHRPTVVVPLLLAAGYHVRVDIADAVAAAGALASPPLGPDPALTGALLDRLAGRPAVSGLVLAAAGSSDPGAAAEVDRLADTLASHLDRPVTTAYLSAAGPDVPTAVAVARARTGGPIGVLSYLLAPGFFAERLQGLAAGAGASWVTDPLAGHPALAELALRRYDEAVAAAVPRGH
ncbi:MAG TPA: sirohydrochlorin chelatase [Kineosporiaceae bacterium]|nr:sirohydrochlorin chelatase [Kineosporiaceae bacterium]